MRRDANALFCFSDKSVMFLCCSVMWSVTARLLFSGGKGTFLPCALYLPVWCRFPGRSEITLYESTSGAMGSHGYTVSIKKNSRMAVWEKYK